MISTTVLAAFTVVGASACSQAESRDAPAGEAAVSTPPRPTIPSGTSMVFTVDETISTEDNEQGDRFTATLRGDVSDVEGTPLISEGASSRWLVTQSTSEDGEALLAVQLESVRTDVGWVPVTATVTAADVRTDEADTRTESAAKVGVGAAAGALVGQILGGNTGSALQGAGVGAAAGAVVALSTRGGSATLPAGSSITVELTEPLIVS
jgi:hypothetical protein